MADVALMPEGDVFQRYHCVPTQDSSEATQSFTCNRIAFVGHGRATFLAFAKKFFDFQNLSALEMAEFSGPTVDRRRDQCQCRQKFSVPVALDDLGRDCRRPQPEFLANFALDPWIQMRMRAHRAAEFPNANALTRLREAFFGAAKFIEH